MIHLDYRDARPIYIQIMEGIREKIVTGILRPGDRLPSVRELASQLTINPNTIQRSYRQLEAEGWICTVPGKGCFVSGDDGTRERELNRCYRAFDDAAAALSALGVPREDMIRRLREGGNTHA